jgi:hypothetical protein
MKRLAIRFVLCKNASMPNEKPGKHNVASLALIVKRIGELQAQVITQQGFLEITPEVSGVVVPREPSLEQGIDRLRSWTDSLRDAVYKARLQAARGGKRVVSDEPSGRARQKKTAL